MKNPKRIIVLHGTNDDYLFHPHGKSSQLRKVSKFSRVYKGISCEGKDVVIKLLPSELAKDPQMVSLFHSEINWWGVHPNILAPFEYITQDNRHYLISDFMQGINLTTYLKRIRNFRKTRIRLAIDCGLQLLDAVEAMHNKGVIHADIKPANVMLATNKAGIPDFKNPQFQLIDFGMVRIAGTPPTTSNKKSKRSFVLVYSPPEQVLGVHELTHFTSDFHNIALLMYEIITKKPIYDSNLSVMIMNLQTSYPLEKSKVIPENLMQIIHKAAYKYHFKKPPNHYKKNDVITRLNYAVAQRYQSAEEFRKDLLAFKNTFNQV